MATIYLYSHGSDFAPTQALPEGVYLGRVRQGQRRLFRCGCASARLRRIHRLWWMRLLPLLRLYGCKRCGAQVLRTRLRGHVYPMM